MYAKNTEYISGGIIKNDNNGTINIINSNFTGNNITNDTSYLDPATVIKNNNGTINITNSIFNKNNIEQEARLIYSRESSITNILNSNFTQNNVTNIYSLISSTGNFSLINSNFIENNGRIIDRIIMVILVLLIQLSPKIMRDM